MKDAWGRRIDYLRVSITDRCNLRCRYCMPEDLPCIPHENILRYEEIVRICAAAASIGIRTLKVTGGEPLARRGCMELLRELKRLPGIEHVTLTTNGTLLGPHVDALAAMGIDGVNISLDTLDPQAYERLTGQDRLAQAMRSLRSAVDAGLRVKVNCVPMRKVNGGELAAIAALAERDPLDVRFIELMPSLSGQPFGRISGEQALRILRRAYPDLSPTDEPRGFGPARYYRSEQLTGCIGLIEAVSNHFCSACNRVRLTSEGFLKLCLYYKDGVDLRALLRAGASDAAIAGAIQQALLRKPERHHFGEEFGHPDNGIGSMSQIGG